MTLVRWKGSEVIACLLFQSCHRDSHLHPTQPETKLFGRTVETELFWGLKLKYDRHRFFWNETVAIELVMLFKERNMKVSINTTWNPFSSKHNNTTQITQTTPDEFVQLRVARSWTMKRKRKERVQGPCCCHWSTVLDCRCLKTEHYGSTGLLFLINKCTLLSLTLHKSIGCKKTSTI